LLLKTLGNIPEDEALRAIAYILIRETLSGEAQKILLASGRRAVLPLMGILDISEDRVMRMRLLDVLTQIGKEATDLIAKRLEDDRWYVRRNVCLLLARVGDQATMSVLLPCLKDRDPRVRIEAVKGISDLGKQDAEEALIDAMSDKDYQVKEEVVRNLGQRRRAVHNQRERCAQGKVSLGSVGTHRGCPEGLETRATGKGEKG